ncbi:DUF6328 family protein [Arsenicicoccus sp. oral taxon 190]|uniref:DUF6328 family protein n=1 Tax=Arsenicicoccus sp. oral taxon 190 TaxID=1658671 RepID=UPI00067A2269|nr:DUF6328 family protein [Arsenicicoccus sp. oral taxon 190]AKT51025.1 hypothetical protein ADJ73_06330 [Arsenicicoccus sp. oral taxon 190]
MDRKRDETAAERMDRNWNELLQELRVIQTGIQVLAGFLITLPFQQRFATLEDAQRHLYLVVVSLALLAVVLLLTPVVVHRALFRHGVKDTVVQLGSRLTAAGFVALGLTLVGTGVLIAWVVTGSVGGMVGGGLAMVVLALLWGLVPLLAHRVVKHG